MNARAVVFDFGGPVLRTPFEMLRSFERRLGLAPYTIDWMGPFDADSDPCWRDMLAGKISEREYWRRRAREIAPFTGGTEVRDLFAGLYSGPPGDAIRAEAEAMLAAAKRSGLATAILTNDLRDFQPPGWADGVAFVGAVDVLVDASVTGVFKPDPGAYAGVVDALGIAADEAVFIDDQPRNVAGARAAGLRAVHFDVRDPAGSYARLAEAAGLA